MSDDLNFDGRVRGPSESSISSLDNSRLNSFNHSRQRVRGLIRNFTRQEKNKLKPATATVTEN